MEISYDEKNDVLYMEFCKGGFVKNKKVDDLTILDLDNDGNIIGIEFLDASKRIPAESLSKLYVKDLQVVTI